MKTSLALASLLLLFAALPQMVTSQVEPLNQRSPSIKENLQKYDLEKDIEQTLNELIDEIHKERAMISDGRSMGDRKDTLKKLSRLKIPQIQTLNHIQSNFEELLELKDYELTRAESLKEHFREKFEQAQEKVDYQQETITRLREELDRRPHPNSEYICTVKVYRSEFFGISSSREIARKEALLECSKFYHLNLQCKRADIECQK